jgi:hypothetical protein
MTRLGREARGSGGRSACEEAEEVGSAAVSVNRSSSDRERAPTLSSRGARARASSVLEIHSNLHRARMGTPPELGFLSEGRLCSVTQNEPAQTKELRPRRRTPRLLSKRPVALEETHSREGMADDSPPRDHPRPPPGHLRCLWPPRTPSPPFPSSTPPALLSITPSPLTLQTCPPAPFIAAAMGYPRSHGTSPRVGSGSGGYKFKK